MGVKAVKKELGPRTASKTAWMAVYRPTAHVEPWLRRLVKLLVCLVDRSLACSAGIMEEADALYLAQCRAVCRRLSQWSTLPGGRGLSGAFVTTCDSCFISQRSEYTPPTPTSSPTTPPSSAATEDTSRALVERYIGGGGDTSSTSSSTSKRSRSSVGLTPSSSPWLPNTRDANGLNKPGREA